MFRVPIALFALIGMGIFSSFLIANIFYNSGSFAISFDMESNKKGIKDWIGLSFYVCNDIFAWGLMSQVIQIPSRMALYRKERMSGLYGSTAFYLSLWLG